MSVQTHKPSAHSSSSSADEVSPIVAELQLPGYQVGRCIGEGGMARVYQGVQQSLRRPVAIKVLNAQMQAQDQARRSFERESLIIARLNHPNIVQVIDRGVTDSGLPFFVMEYIDGVDLARVVREGQLTIMRKLDFAQQIAKALAYAHKNGVLHRDIKPANVIVDKQMHVKVLDFGIAGFVRSAQKRGVSKAVAQKPAPQTYEQNPETLPPEKQEVVMGTLAYMAPEVRNSSRKASPQSDIYSLGVIMYELLTGILPGEEFKAPSQLVRGISKELNQLVMSCLHPHPGKRPQRAERVAEALLEMLHGSHLDARQAERARASLGKKSFTLLDIWRENRFGAVYLFLEKTRHQRYVIKKAMAEHVGYQMGRRLAGLEHPNLVGVHGASKSDRAFIVVMDYMPGGSLQERLLRPFELGEFLLVARQVCAGLSFAHRNHVLHGNLRASNILFDADDRVRLTDFGWPSHYQSDAKNKTSSMSSEQKNNWYQLPDEDMSVAADIYACGVIFYQMLIGELPRQHKGNLEIGRAFKRLPESLRHLLVSMLDADPLCRPASVELLLRQLDDANDDMPTQVWQGKSASAASATDEYKEQKQWLLFFLLILLFLALANTGVIAIFEGWQPFGIDLSRWL